MAKSPLDSALRAVTKATAHLSYDAWEKRTHGEAPGEPLEESPRLQRRVVRAKEKGASDDQIQRAQVAGVVLTARRAIQERFPALQ